MMVADSGAGLVALARGGEPPPAEVPAFVAGLPEGSFLSSWRPLGLVRGSDSKCREHGEVLRLRMLGDRLPMRSATGPCEPTKCSSVPLRAALGSAWRAVGGVLPGTTGVLLAASTPVPCLVSTKEMRSLLPLLLPLFTLVPTSTLAVQT